MTVRENREPCPSPALGPDETMALAWCSCERFIVKIFICSTDAALAGSGGKGLRTLALILALLSLLGIVSCSGGSNTATITAVTVSCTPTSLQSGQTSSCTASVTGTGTF